MVKKLGHGGSLLRVLQGDTMDKVKEVECKLIFVAEFDGPLVLATIGVIEHPLPR